MGCPCSKATHDRQNQRQDRQAAQSASDPRAPSAGRGYYWTGPAKKPSAAPKAE